VVTTKKCPVAVAVVAIYCRRRSSILASYAYCTIALISHHTSSMPINHYTS
jgi:hypothetical protein